MDELFRFATVRGAQSTNTTPTVALTGVKGTTAFQDQLRPLRGTDNSYFAMAEAAREYEQSANFADPGSKLALGTKMLDLGKHLEAMAAMKQPGEAPRSFSPTPPPAAPVPPTQGVPVPPQAPKTDPAATATQAPPVSLAAAISRLTADIAGMEPGDLSANPQFLADLDRVHDSLVALFLAPATGRPAPPPIDPAATLGPVQAEGGPLPQTPISQIGGIATYTPPLDHAVAMGPLAAIARVMDLILRIAKNDPTVNLPGAVAEALTRTLMLPPTIFPIFPARSLRPVGISDLRVVRQHVVRYEGGEIGNIQNLMAGEARANSNKHTLSIEQTTTTQQEKTTETSKDLKTTERFDLKNEAEKTVKEDTSVKAGLSVSAKYGSMLAVDASLDVSYSTAKQDASKTASDYAKDVTTRAASKVTQRIMSQEVSKTLETFLDQEDHGFDNSAGPAHIRGVYQWVNKVYQAQVFNYGKRLMFDIAVPEPAAFLLSTIAAGAQGAKPVAPPAFTLDGQPGDPLRPVDLSPNQTKMAKGAEVPDPGYYQTFAARYGVQGLETPPAPQVVVSKALSAFDTSADDNTNLLIDSLDTLKIPDGYAASAVRVNGTYTQKNAHGGKQVDLPLDAWIYVFPGSAAFVFDENNDTVPITDSGWKFNTIDFTKEPTAGAIDRMALALSTLNVQAMSLTLEVVCNITPAWVERWQLRIYTGILEAFNKMQSDYQDRLSAYSFSLGRPGGPVPLGGSEGENRAIERRELRKSALEILMGRNLADQNLGAVIRGNYGGPGRGSPKLDLAQVEVQGAYSRFFEQAFEWEEMSYVFYPYYWSRLETWYDKALMTHNDPQFEDFLKAGEARVVIPVRPGFEEDLNYYLMTGQIWHGGDLPGVADHDYLPITDEIKANSGAPGAEKPEGDPWEVIVPTKLVQLRDDGKAPAWMQMNPGDWSRWVDDPAHFV